MLSFVLSKALTNALACLGLYLLARNLSENGPVYASFLAGFLGFCYLLFAWLSYLKSRGSQPFALLRRRQAPQVPQSLRSPNEKPRRSLRPFAPRYPVEDSLDEEAGEAHGEIPRALQLRAGALIYLGLAILLLALSMWQS